MERSLKYCLSLLFGISMGWSGCTHIPDRLTEAEREALVEAKFDTLHRLYQGSPENMRLLREVTVLEPCHAEAWRELSIPYLKRGYPGTWAQYSNKVIACGGHDWIGYRGHNYLFFYRDYERALQDFNALDTLTPGFTDYPQATSDLYLRGLCYFGLKQYEKAMAYFDKYIAEEAASPGGFDFIDQNAFLYRGIIRYRLGEYTAALEEFKQGLRLFDQSADLHFHIARTKLALENLEGAYESIERSQKYFQMGYFNQHGYVEVLEQIYLYDIQHLKEHLQSLFAER